MAVLTVLMSQKATSFTIKRGPNKVIVLHRYLSHSYCAVLLLLYSYFVVLLLLYSYCIGGAGFCSLDTQ